jgi:putative PIN family toxin of toxin-antitoxin system
VRVVFDTNIFISAFVVPRSRAEEAIRRVMTGQDALIISKAIIDELLTTLSRKFSRDQEELAHVAVFLTEIGTAVHPKRRVRILKDDPDNRVLECAVAGRADAVVTGDRAMLSLGQYHEIPILPLATYLASP